jgi:hypothetical protein
MRCPTLSLILGPVYLPVRDASKALQIYPLEELVEPVLKHQAYYHYFLLNTRICPPVYTTASTLPFAENWAVETVPPTITKRSCRLQLWEAKSWRLLPSRTEIYCSFLGQGSH